MSILQEYEKIKKDIGEEKWDSIGLYLSQHKNLTFDKLIYNKECYIEFEEWFYENIKLQRVEILGIWDTDYDDIGCSAVLYKNDIPVANIRESYEEITLIETLENKDSNFNEEMIKRSMKLLILNRFDHYLCLPKISECSKLLQVVYDCVCQSDSSMCHIDYDEWNDYYCDDFTKEDINTLKKEIKKYKLDDLVEVDNGEYKIIGYGNLQFSFNDTREFENDLLKMGAELNEYLISDWMTNHPELFEDNEYMKEFLLKVRRLKNAMNDFTNFFEETCEEKDIYSSPIFSDLREINNMLDKLNRIIHDKYKVNEHKYHIEEMDILQTGGNVFVYVGALTDGFYFSHVDDEVYIYDAKPFEESQIDNDEYNWHKNHLIDTLTINKHNKYFYDQMNIMLEKRNLSDTYEKIFQQHFENIFKEIEDSSYEK